MATTTERGLGWQHQKARRAALAAMQDGDPCCLCGLPMWHGQALDYDHTVDRTGYRGLAHATCNRSDGGRRSRQTRRPTRWTSRRW